MYQSTRAVLGTLMQVQQSVRKQRLDISRPMLFTVSTQGKLLLGRTFIKGNLKKAHALNDGNVFLLYVYSRMLTVRESDPRRQNE